MGKAVNWTKLFPECKDGYFTRDSTLTAQGVRHYRVKLPLAHSQLARVQAALGPEWTVSCIRDSRFWIAKVARKEMLKCIRRDTTGQYVFPERHVNLKNTGVGMEMFQAERDMRNVLGLGELPLSDEELAWLS